MTAMTAPRPAPSQPPRDAAREWLLALASLVAPMYPADVAEAFRAYLPLLADVPVEAFCPDTLDAAARCASARNSVPTYREVREVLAQWRRARLPLETRGTTGIAELPPAERCTPDQAATILARHGLSLRPIPAALDGRHVTPRYLTGEQLAEARRRAGIRVVMRPAATSSDDARAAEIHG